MNILVIEDDKTAQSKLINMIRSVDQNIEILTVIESVRDAVDWFNTNSVPDLIFSDVQLADGLCFEIFEQVKISSPIIFTSGYDNYAINAFKSNGIDYLLKPVTEIDLKESLEKYYNYSENHPEIDNALLNQLIKQIRKPNREYKRRFLIKHKQNLKIIPVKDIAYFFIENQLLFLYTFDKRKFVLSYNMNNIEDMVDPDDFFRLNRQVIINLQSVESIHDYFSDSLKINLKPAFLEDIIIKRPKISEFKSWIDR